MGKYNYVSKYDINETMRIVTKEIQQYKFNLPEKYSLFGSMKSALIIIENLRDKNGVAILPKADPSSIYLALMRMGVQALNPVKDQCYFIPYWNNNKRQYDITLIRGYLGSIMVAKTVDKKIHRIRARSIFKGDDIKIETFDGVQIVTRHEQTIESIDSKVILGAYAIAIDENKNLLDAEFMTRAQIHQAWRQSRFPPFDNNGKIKEGTTHAKYPDIMSERTVIQRLCKRIINTSDDSHFLEMVEMSSEEYDIDNIIEIKANSKELDMDTSNDVAKPETQQKQIEQPQEMKDIDIEPDDVIEMATEQQCKTIEELTKQLGKHNQMLKLAGDFSGRMIMDLKQMTTIEANSFIMALSDQLGSSEPDVPEPNWD